MAVWIVYDDPNQGRADGYTGFMVSTASTTADAARIKAEKLVGLYDGSGSPSHFAKYLAVKIGQFGSAFNGSQFVPDICFQGAHIVGPRSVLPNAGIFDFFPRLGRGGRFLRGPMWLFGQD